MDNKTNKEQQTLAQQMVIESYKERESGGKYYSLDESRKIIEELINKK